MISVILSWSACLFHTWKYYICYFACVAYCYVFPYLYLLKSRLYCIFLHLVYVSLSRRLSVREIFFSRCAVIPGDYWKYEFWITLIHVVLTGLNTATFIYSTISVWFLIWYALFIDGSFTVTICLLLIPPPRVFSIDLLYGTLFHIGYNFHSIECLLPCCWKLLGTLDHIYF